jgi:Putative Flp pilus-assembly TadE/G-like
MKEKESGQLMIIVALGMVALMGFVAVVVDLGNAYSQRRLAQNAADAAAMAAVRMIRMSDPSTLGSFIHGEIVRVAGLNGNAQVDPVNTNYLGTTGSILGQVNSYGGSLSDVAGVTVKTYISYNTYFAGIVGINTMTSGAHATAMSLAVDSVTGVALRPIAVREHPDGDSTKKYEVGSSYLLWDSKKESPGNAGWLDFDAGSNGAKELTGWITDGFGSNLNPFTFYHDRADQTPGDSETNKTLRFPSWLEGNPGVKASAKSAVEGLIGKSITIVLYSKITGSGANCKYRVVGMAQFSVTSADEKDAIYGTFQRMVVASDPSPTPTTGNTSTIRLTQ